MNEDTAAALKQKTETARVNRSKRKVISMTEGPPISIKRPRSGVSTVTVAPKVLSQSNARTSAVTVAPKAVSLPKARPSEQSAPPPESAPKISPPAKVLHNWVVLRRLPLSVTAREVEGFLEGISLHRPSNVPPAARSRGGTSSGTGLYAAFVKQPWGAVGVDVYVEMATSHGAVLAAKRSGEPLREGCCPLVEVGYENEGLGLVEVYWARGVCLEIPVKGSVEEGALELAKAGVPLSLVRSLSPSVLATRWPSFASAISATQSQDRRSHPLAHVFWTSSHPQRSFPLVASTDASEAEPRWLTLSSEEVEAKALLAALGDLWAQLALVMTGACIGGVAEDCTMEGTADAGRREASAVMFVGRVMATFKCLCHLLELRASKPVASALKIKL